MPEQLFKLSLTRIYDRNIKMHFDVELKDGMWVIDVKKNQNKLIMPEKRKISIKNHEKIICIFHDIEGEFGNTNAKPVPANFADTLKKILNIEKETNIKTTYNVVGPILTKVRKDIEKGGHSLAFHSFNHQVSCQPNTNYMQDETEILTPLSKLGYKLTYCINLVRSLLSLPPVSYQPVLVINRKVQNKIRSQLALPPIINQFAECRNIDWRIKGYRHYQPEPIENINDKDLCYYNFEWIAIDDKTPDAGPILQNRVVKIPVFCDIFEMHQSGISYETWEKAAVERIKQSNFTAIGLHGSYSSNWLPYYSDFVKTISSLGQLKTFNEVADHTFWSNSI